MADTITECESFFQEKINNMLVTTSWVDDLKNLLGVEAVSQIWGDVPAWYMWLSDALGVYHLKLVDAAVDEDNPADKQAFFSIKCYPFHNATVFDKFSYEEQHLSGSRFFDDTHTPRFEEKEKIPDSLFNVAAMEYWVNRDDTLACFTLESLDTMRSVYPEETVLDFDLIHKSRRYKKGETGRSVPGWKLGYPVFDRLLSMYAFYSKATPVRLRITRSPGFEYVHTGNQLFECVDTPDTHRLAASVFFAHQGRLGHTMDINELDMVEQTSEQGQVEILFDRAFPCGHLHASDKMESAKIDKDTPINELWWSLAHTEYKSELASTCGCH
jgi:hypothetical protein